MTTRVGTILDCPSGQSMRLPGSSHTPDGDKCAERFADYSRMRVPLLGGSEMPAVGSVKFNRGWTLNEIGVSCGPQWDPTIVTRR